LALDGPTLQLLLALGGAVHTVEIGLEKAVGQLSLFERFWRNERGVTNG